MPREAISLAQRFRRARESFILARELGCSPAEALERKRSEEAARRWRESGERLRAAQARSERPLPGLSITADAPASVVAPDHTTPPAQQMWWHD